VSKQKFDPPPPLASPCYCPGDVGVRGPLYFGCESESYGKKIVQKKCKNMCPGGIEPAHIHALRRALYHCTNEAMKSLLQTTYLLVVIWTRVENPPRLEKIPTIAIIFAVRFLESEIENQKSKIFSIGSTLGAIQRHLICWIRPGRSSNQFGDTICSQGSYA
jgi:hypothetical protein